MLSWVASDEHFWTRYGEDWIGGAPLSLCGPDERLGKKGLAFVHSWKYSEREILAEVHQDRVLVYIVKVA
jgi:hypothetical protein